MNVKTQSFLVLGVSKSGYAVADYILKNDGKCFLYEEMQTEKITSSINELVSRGAVFVGIDAVESILPSIDVVVISPGIPINYKIAVRAKELGKRIVGELEFGYLNLSPTIIGVTGTNGKTTTVSLIDAILKEDGKNSFLVGNVGCPLTTELDKMQKDAFLVTEVSSFQLESINAFCPHVACVLNIAPDHLERHYTMENYIFLKKRLLKNLKESEFAVLNYDDEIVKGFSSDTRAKIVWVSVRERVDGAYLNGDTLYYKNQAIIDVQDLSIGGIHNVYNSLFAIGVCSIYGVKPEVIKSALQNFKGVKHRLEFIAEINGVKYVNDSKATNTASTITAIDSMKSPTILILGGSEKGEKYDSLFQKIRLSRVKSVVLTGASRYNMLDSASRQGITEITLTPSFKNAVEIAHMIAEPNDTVLLSPACASFDNFSDFEQRGETFKQIVESLS